MDIKAIVETTVKKIKADPKLLSSFSSDPEKTIENIAGVDIPDGQLDKVVKGVKEKLGGSASGVLGKIKKLF